MSLCKRIMLILCQSMYLCCLPSLVQADFSFIIASDQTGYTGPYYNTKSYFRGAVEAIHNQEKGDFLISVGDIGQVHETRLILDQVLGTDFMLFPVMGNHEHIGTGYLELEDYYSSYIQDNTIIEGVNPGPDECSRTTYSFDYHDAHFMIIDEYCGQGNGSCAENNHCGDIRALLYDWMEDDLKNTDQQHVFVFGHEPAFPQPDADGDKGAPSIRHLNESLDYYPVHRDNFWQLLNDYNVTAYFCGHTHSYSSVRIDSAGEMRSDTGVWQIDTGHAAGMGKIGKAPSTFFIVDVTKNHVKLNVYRERFLDQDIDYDDFNRQVVLAHENNKPSVGEGNPWIRILLLK